jgi:hypothetical protein
MREMVNRKATWWMVDDRGAEGFGGCRQFPTRIYSGSGPKQKSNSSPILESTINDRPGSFFFSRSANLVLSTVSTCCTAS